MTEQIPGPTGLPIVGNMFSVQNPEGYLKAVEGLADIYGPIFQITLSGQRFINVSSTELLLEMLDDKKWEAVPLDELSRDIEAKGMFNAWIDHPDWGQARRILNPSFGPLAIETMFEGMRDIANQMLMKWARMGDGHRILLTDDFTRFAFDTIALCTMDYRFNSFYREDLHPFIDAMLAWISNSAQIAVRPWFINKLLPGLDTEKKKAKAVVDKVAQEVIDERRRNPKPGNDLVNTMLFAKDPKTGEVMRDSLVRENMLAFLVAGHETTSSLISFAFANMIKYPQVYLKARQEVDEVIGTGRVEVAHVKKLKYLAAVLRETLRLTPTVPALSRKLRAAVRDQGTTLGGGRYYVGPDDTVDILLTKAQRDQLFFGSDADEFKPERMMNDNPQLTELNKAWKPFGFGSRACIGQSFAWQEAMQITAMILQNYDLNFSDPGYQMKITEVITIKPDNLYVDVRLRKRVTPETLEKRLFSGQGASEEQKSDDDKSVEAPMTAETKLAILFGSNTGSCQSLAQKLASKISAAFKIKVATHDLDSVAGNLPNCPILIITATYEGQPPDNAGRFVAWLEGQKAGSLSNVKYSVFGLGNKNWQATYHRIPKLIDSSLEAAGATRLVPLRGVDVSTGDITDELESWYGEGLEKELRQVLDIEKSDESSSEPTASAEIFTDQRATSISNGMVLGKVLHNDVLTAPDHPEKRHMEIQLPTGATYECGDYLAVLPLNGKDLVRRIMAHWNLPHDSTIVLKSASFAPLLLDVPLSVFDILTGYFELSQPPSRKALQNCAVHATEQTTKDWLNTCISDTQKHDATFKQSPNSLFDVIKSHPDINLPFPLFLSSLSPLRPRQYSISSSPLVHTQSCTLTYGVFRSTPSSANDSTPLFEGVASNYLASLLPGDTLQISVRRTATANKPCPFRLPTAPKSTPLLMIGAGTGLAPFRGFIQERARMIELNPSIQEDLAPAVLFMGCRSPTADRLYAAEMDKWIAMGAVDVRYAFSRDPDASQGCRYVGDRIWADRRLVEELWEGDARLYLCGNRALLAGVEDAFMRIIEDFVGTEDAEKLEREKREFREECSQRAVSDIFD